MSYLDSFFSEKKPMSELERLIYSVKLSYEFIGHAFNEFSRKHRLIIEKDYFDEEKLSDWMDCLVDIIPIKLFEYYFNPEIQGVENIPLYTGGLLTSNHSGMWGWDGMSIFYRVFKDTGRIVSMVGDNIFERSDMIKTIGAISGNPRNVRNLLEEDRLALVCPGGSREVAKPFWKRYKMQKVGGFAEERYGYLLVALEAKKPIIPVGVVGAEETHIILGDAKPCLQKSLNKIYDFLPNEIKEKYQFTGTLMEMLNKSHAFPLPLNPLPFPSKIDIWIGEPLHLYRDLNETDYEVLGKYKERCKDPETKHPLEHYLLNLKLSAMNYQVLAKINGLIRNGREYRRK